MIITGMHVNSIICMHCNRQVLPTVRHLQCLLPIVYKQPIDRKEKEKLTLFSNHNGSLLRQQLGAKQPINAVNRLQTGCHFLHNGPHSNGHIAEAVGGGVLIPEGNREGSEEAEVQSFVVPVANGIQLETRRRTRQQPTHAAQDVSPQMQPVYTCHVSQASLCFTDIAFAVNIHKCCDWCKCGCLPLP